MHFLDNQACWLFRSEALGCELLWPCDARDKPGLLPAKDACGFIGARYGTEASCMKTRTLCSA